MDTIKLSARFHRISLLLALLLSFISAIVLLGGWIADIAFLRNLGLGYSMQANTAICILSASLALWLLNPLPPLGARRTLGQGLAMVPLLLGALTLLEHFYDWDLGIDQAFFRDHGPIPGSHDGRMALNGALAATCIGLALLLLANQIYQRFAEKLALIVIVLELLAIFGHSYGALEFYQIGPHKPQITQGSWAFLLLGVALLFTRPRQGLMATLSSDSAGGILLRRMLPVAILLPPLIVKLRLTGQNLGLYDAASGLTLFVTLMILILCTFIWSSAILLRQVDKQRRQAILDLQAVNRNLDQQVALRTQELAQTNEDLQRQVRERTRAEARFRGLFEAAPDAILIVDQQGIILQANPQTERWFGYSQQELQSQPVEILLPESQRGAHRAHLQGYMAMPLRQSMAAGSHPYGLHKNGHSFPVSVNLSPFESEGRALVIAIVRDISEQEQLQRERLELAERHEELLQNLPVGVCRYALNPAMPLLEANRTAIEMLEAHHLQELLQHPLSMFLKNPQAIEPLHEMLLKQNVIQHAETEFITLQGRSFWAGLSLRLKVDTEGGLYCNATFRDISERKRAFAKIQDLNAELEAANKELEAFSYSVSHDLRAPLRAIDGFSQAMLEDYQDRLDSTGQDYLRRLRAAAQRMGHLIDDMLQLSRITRADLVVAEVDLSAMAIEIATELSQREPQRVVDFRISPDLITMGDAQLLRIALTNLFENAWKFTARREISIITFASRDGDQGPIYFIQDNGVGFDMAYANKLFQAFQRLHDAREFPGTGIGLAIVQRVIQKHGGKIWAQAEPESGATFYFSLQPIIKSV